MVRVISKTCQEFLGVRYWLCGFYFQRKGARLHRVVWEHHKGPIPDGMHVHHVNGNRSENGIENLDLVSQSEHLSHHGRVGDRSSWAKAMRAGARKWHGSKEGRAWHSEHAKGYMAKILAPRVAKNCEQCGKTFMAHKVIAARSKFCHPNCKAKALRKRRAGR